MQTIENGAEILASIAGALGVTDERKKEYTIKDVEKHAKGYKEIEKKINKKIDEIRSLHFKMLYHYDHMDFAKKDGVYNTLSKHLIEKYKKQPDLPAYL